MTSYIREQSAGGIFQDAYNIYKSNFTALFLHYFIPVFPFSALEQFASLQKDPLLTGVASLAAMLVTMLVFPFITVAVSEICLGNKASVQHSFRRVLSKSMKGFILTYLLLLLLMFVGLILFIIPAIVFVAWYLFTLQIVVIESLYGNKALRRSKELGKGYYLRNLGILLMLYIVMIVVYLLLALLIVGPIHVSVALIFPAGIDSEALKLLYAGIDAAIICLLAPFPAIGVVLLYYDMRARKESYDSRTLAEDLMR